jgi:hypothetical protein
MRSQTQLNYPEFVRGFRAACALRGIDPQEGSTIYQAVLVRAELARAAYQPDGWWKRHEHWQGSMTYRNELEEGVIWNLFLESYIPKMYRLAMLVALRNARLPLRELYEHVKEREFNE